MISGCLGGWKKKSLGFQWVDTSFSEISSLKLGDVAVCGGLSACPAYSVGLEHEHSVMKFSYRIC